MTYTLRGQSFVTDSEQKCFCTWLIWISFYLHVKVLVAFFSADGAASQIRRFSLSLQRSSSHLSYLFVTVALFENTTEYGTMGFYHS